MTRYTLWENGNVSSVEATRKLDPGGADDTAVNFSVTYTFGSGLETEEWYADGRLADVQVIAGTPGSGQG